MINDLLDPAVVQPMNLLGGAWQPAWARQRRWVAQALSFGAVRPGMRVLELGTTYDGYPATVLDQLVGPGGSVISVSANPAAVDRAIAEHGTGIHGRLSFQPGAVLDGWPLGAPYDLIISIRPVRRIPHAWLRQCRLPGRLGADTVAYASIVAPLRVPGHSPARLLRVDIDEEHQPNAPRLHHPIRHKQLRLHGDLAGYTLRIHRATDLHQRDAHYVFTVRQNQPKLFAALDALP